MSDYAKSRTRMVNTQLRTNDVTDHRILDAMEIVPREKFVPASKRVIAYIDEDLPIGPQDSNRFLLKPHVFGKLVQMADIRDGDVALVIGAGTGYAAAVLSKLAASVVAVEENPALAATAGDVLVELGIENAAVVEGPLVEGYASEGPYDVILICGAVEVLPDMILNQLKAGGRLVVIEGRSGAGQAKLYQNSNGAVSGRFVFNASAAVLPGFEKVAEFQF